jgi:hypothetical protein
MLIGQAIAVPWSESNVYVSASEPGIAPTADFQVESTMDDARATRILERFEGSSGVHATFLLAPDGQVLFRRDGRARVPFNLLFDADPRVFAAPTRSASPVHDVRLVR